MKLLVANLGSTSFKYRLFSLNGEQAALLARGGSERVTDYGAAIDHALGELARGGHVQRGEELDGVGFKTVFGGELTGCVLADERVEQALLDTADLAPAHNPPYAAGLKLFRERLPSVPRVALFETAFYQWVPDYARRYAVPEAWHAAGIRRFGFHGASHKFVAERSAELLARDEVAAVARRLYLDGPRPIAGAPLRVISCHLGGSSSVTAIVDGVAVGTSMGLSPQSGLVQSTRVGDLDSAALGCAMRRLQLAPADAERQLVKDSGLLGLSGVSGDLRDIRAAADQGNARAQLAIDVFIHSIRHWIGAFWFELGGCDALVFTGGIGENNPWLREAVCTGLCDLGLFLDPDANASSPPEFNLADPDSRTRVLVIPANEELVVAREAARLIAARAIPAGPPLAAEPRLPVDGNPPTLDSQLSTPRSTLSSRL
ncbi:acetate/propionate family kinase [Opitutus terrae]|uniref:Acetate kinase n=1 Tax=Opitutus terrae (strain DSM 11246 / JCM 15787 / PB90-1) TaxID=452637 RepID=B1ZR90_OPITP|nr:acetate kinase [Opitutus terrae]ACB74577.1 acetate kinase [Opitutus terrae PB90-1]